MKKRDLEILIRKTYLDLQKKYGLHEYALLPAYDGKKGRKNTGLYYHLRLLKNHAWQGRRYDYDDYGHKEEQIFEYEVKFTALSDNPEHNPNDIASQALMIVQSLPFIETLSKSDVGLQRVNQLRSMPFINDSDNYEEEVFFTFNLSVVQTINPPTPSVDTFNVKIHKV